MEGKERIYYALGLLAHAVAMADGEVQKSEIKKMHQIIAEEIQISYNFDYSEIIFDLLERSPISAEDAFNYAFQEIDSASYYLSDDMKSDFPAILEKVARSFPPYTDEEKNWIERIKERLEKV